LADYSLVACRRSPVRTWRSLARICCWII
jgi:hypothetical protein